eukprot:TRINITY_DN1333_c0_g1_i4.p1 TRINITY_DN1333_c0_g1~~TRINITY_DN1333_c0_g1_i4.p1  ORF type:complete len:479 (-),score=76.14 TRINITY_DN1333_c0_g1_i4:477-1913(-)
MRSQILVSIVCVFGLWQGSFAGEGCKASDALNALTNYGSKTQFIVDTYDKYNNIRSEFKTLEGILSSSCEAVVDRRSLFDKLTGVFNLVQLYKPLKVFIQPVQNVLDKVVSKALGKPVDTFCDGTQKIREKLELFDDKVNATFFKYTTYALKVASHLQKAEEYLSYYESNVKGVCGAPSIDLQFEKICQVSLDLDNFIHPVYVSFKEFYELFAKIEKSLQFALDGFVDPLMDIFDKLDIVLDPIQDFLDIKFKIPFPGGSKSRGVGEVPTCCPSGYKNSAGLCYKNCRSGYETVGLICMRKCKSGWRTIGPVCQKGFKVRTRKTYGRGVGQIPATFGNDACDCRSNKKYLEAGLCYNKCGRDSFSNYPTAVLDRCWDFSPKSWSISDLVANLDILDKINDIPGLGDAINAINKLIDQVFSVLTDKIQELLDINLPALPSVDFGLSIPDVLLDIQNLNLNFPELGGIIMDYPNWPQFTC